MKSRVFIVLSLASFLMPVAVYAVETRDASELSTKVKCQEAALKEFKKTLPEDVKIEDVVKSARTSKSSGDAV